MVNNIEIIKLETKAREARRKVISMIYKAQSGHPGGSLSAADIMTVLYFKVLNIDPQKPNWQDRDRFVLSKGHACPIMYVCLQMRGFFEKKHLYTFRTINSILQGHPDMKKTPGVDMTTGSLGIGAACALGMALEAKMEGSNRNIYTMVGDGEINEGVIWEVMQAGYKFKLDNYCMILDKNGLQLNGPTSEIMPIHNLKQIVNGFGWAFQEIDGHSIPQIINAFNKFKKTKNIPTFIMANTVKGKGISFMENQLKWHGQAPNEIEYRQAIKELSEEQKR